MAYCRCFALLAGSGSFAGRVRDRPEENVVDRAGERDQIIGHAAQVVCEPEGRKTVHQTPAGESDGDCGAREADGARAAVERCGSLARAATTVRSSER